MDEDSFWHIIGLFDWDWEGYDGNVLQPAIDALSKLSLQDLNQFEEILAEKLYALDGEVYARNIGEHSYGEEDKYFSVDKFLYIRCCVVANGKEFYYHVLNNPSDMPKDVDYEPLLTLAYDAACQKGHEDYQHFTKFDYETFRNHDGWQNVI